MVAVEDEPSEQTKVKNYARPIAVSRLISPIPRTQLAVSVAHAAVPQLTIPILLHSVKHLRLRISLPMLRPTVLKIKSSNSFDA